METERGRFQSGDYMAGQMVRLIVMGIEGDFGCRLHCAEFFRHFGTWHADGQHDQV